MKQEILILSILIFMISSCLSPDSLDEGQEEENMIRSDGAVMIGFSDLPGSSQSPAWSHPTINEFVFTNYRSSYNLGNAYLYICDLRDSSIRLLLSGYNVNMPGGGCIWNPVINKIVFTAIRDGGIENAYHIDPDGSNLQMITNEPGYMAWEPGFSPDGSWIVYERVNLSATKHSIYKCEVKNPAHRLIIDDNGDCRQPSWSPRGDYICYQKLIDSEFEIIVCNDDGTQKRRLLDTTLESTDCSFSPDGDWIVFSSEYNSRHANIYICSSEGMLHAPDEWIRVTNDPGYDGAPAWSQDGTQILFEHTNGDPDTSSGASIWMIDVPDLP